MLPCSTPTAYTTTAPQPTPVPVDDTYGTAPVNDDNDGSYACIDPADVMADGVADDSLLRQQAEVQRLAQQMQTQMNPASPALVSAHAAALGLSAADCTHYGSLWDTARAGETLIPAPAAATFLRTSGISTDALRQIWSLSDTTEPKGMLDKDKFFVACKLVAITQHGDFVASLANIGRLASLPWFAHLI